MQKVRSITLSLIVCILICSTLIGLSTVQTASAASMDSWTYGGLSNDYLYGLVETPDGDRMILGSTCSYGAGYSDFWLVKVDAHGNMVWNKTYGGPYNDLGCTIRATTDGGYVMVGYTCTSNATGMDENADGWLIKIDADGNMLWNKTYGAPADSDYPVGVIVTSDGGYLLSGATYPGTSTTEIGWLVKVDVNGTKQWSKTYGNSGVDCLWSSAEASGGGYVLTGQTKVSGSDELWVLKVDADGNELWSKTYGGSSSDLGWCILNAPDGGYAISGFTSSFGAGKSDMWLIKLDSNGAMQWNQTYGGPEDELGHVLAAVPDGGYAIVGSTISYGTSGSSDFWLVKTDSNGVMKWNQTCGGADYDEGQFLSVTSSGVYVVVGVTVSYGAGGTDGWLVISDAFGASTAPTPMPQIASMQTIAIIAIALIAVAVVLVVVLKKRKK